MIANRRCGRDERPRSLLAADLALTLAALLTASACAHKEPAPPPPARISSRPNGSARAVTAYQEAVRLVNIRYASGLSAYFEVLEAQQQLFPAEIGLAQMRRDQLVAMVNLYRALGGGWQAEERAAGSGQQDKGGP